MKYINLVLSAVVLISSASAAPATYSSNRCGPGYGSCDDGYCCSQYGWCGKTEEHCRIDNGCQSNYGYCLGVTPQPANDRCGSKFGNAKCGSGECCSQYGYCGTSKDHCGKGCQSEFGVCNNGNEKKKERCGPNYGSCSSGDCCSKYGWCGTSSDHCGKGCQSEFGRC
ncbi:carbohydrate-binding module family 18 protein, partial [Piromyces sp. E2]